MSGLQVVEDDGPSALLCTRCRDYLNVPPIMTMNQENICGRCYRPEDYTPETRPFRNHPFESLSVMYAFPCKYRKQGCTECKRGEARHVHEQNCLYRFYKCFVQHCEWTGVVVNLQSHFEQNHSHLFSRSGLIHVNADSDYEKSQLVLDKHALYILQTKFVKATHTFWLAAAHIATTQHHKIDHLELAFTSERSNIVFKIAFTNDLAPINTETALELDVLSLNALLGNQLQITGVVTLLMQNGDEFMHLEMLNELECRVCRVYMNAPIFLCGNGHSICEYCSKRVTTCPTCRDPLRSTRNYVLEEVVKHLYYPCKYHLNSCRFITKSTEIRKHEDDCSFRI